MVSRYERLPIARSFSSTRRQIRVWNAEAQLPATKGSYPRFPRPTINTHADRNNRAPRKDIENVARVALAELETDSSAFGTNMPTSYSVRRLSAHVGQSPRQDVLADPAKPHDLSIAELPFLNSKRLRDFLRYLFVPFKRRSNWHVTVVRVVECFSTNILVRSQHCQCPGYIHLLPDTGYPRQ